MCLKKRKAPGHRPQGSRLMRGAAGRLGLRLRGRREGVNDMDVKPFTLGQGQNNVPVVALHRAIGLHELCCLERVEIVEIVILRVSCESHQVIQGVAVCQDSGLQPFLDALKHNLDGHNHHSWHLGTGPKLYLFEWVVVYHGNLRFMYSEQYSSSELTVY